MSAHINISLLDTSNREIDIFFTLFTGAPGRPAWVYILTYSHRKDKDIFQEFSGKKLSFLGDILPFLRGYEGVKKRAGVAPVVNSDLGKIMISC